MTDLAKIIFTVILKELSTSNYWNEQGSKVENLVRRLLLQDQVQMFFEIFMPDFQHCPPSDIFVFFSYFEEF